MWQIDLMKKSYAKTHALQELHMHLCQNFIITDHQALMLQFRMPYEHFPQNLYF